MITWINKLARKLREKNYFFRRLFEIGMDYLWVDKMVVMQLDLEQADLSKTFEKIDVRWWLATREDCEKYFTGVRPGFDVAEGQRMSEFIETGDWFFLGMVDDASTSAPSCYCACNFKVRKLHGREFSLESWEGFIFNVLTVPEQRGKGLAAGVIAEVCRKAKEQRHSLMFADIATSNAASLRTFEKVGFVATGTYYYLFHVFKRHFLIPVGPLRNRFRKQGK